MLNICTSAPAKPRRHTHVYVSCVPSPAALSGSLWGVKCMQADGEGATCRSPSLRSRALTAVDYTPAPSSHLFLGKKKAAIRSSQDIETGDDDRAGLGGGISELWSVRQRRNHYYNHHRVRMIENFLT